MLSFVSDTHQFTKKAASADPIDSGDSYVALVLCVVEKLVRAGRLLAFVY